MSSTLGEFTAYDVMQELEAARQERADFIEAGRKQHKEAREVSRKEDRERRNEIYRKANSATLEEANAKFNEKIKDLGKLHVVKVRGESADAMAGPDTATAPAGTSD